MSEVRLLPLVIGAASALLLLKVVGAVIGDGRIAGPLEAIAQERSAGEDPIAPDEEAARRGGDATGARQEILESLAERREALDERARELDMREKLLEATRARIEERIGELREIEARIEAAVDARREAQEERFASLVTMYESMKARDAAAIFNRLEMAILARVAAQMNARRMAEILAAMDPEVAQRLTIELSAEAGEPFAREDGEEGEELPKIVGTRRDG